MGQQTSFFVRRRAQGKWPVIYLPDKLSESDPEVKITSNVIHTDPDPEEDILIDFMSTTRTGPDLRGPQLVNKV